MLSLVRPACIPRVGHDKPLCATIYLRVRSTCMLYRISRHGRSDKIVDNDRAEQSRVRGLSSGIDPMRRCLTSPAPLHIKRISHVDIHQICRVFATAILIPIKLQIVSRDELCCKRIEPPRLNRHTGFHGMTCSGLKEWILYTRRSDSYHYAGYLAYVLSILMSGITWC